MATTEKDRNCFCCGKTYHYCGHGCKDDNPNEPWRFLFDNENCKVAYDLWQSWRGKEISEDELRDILVKMNLKDILASNTMVSKDFKKILGSDKKYAKKQTKRYEEVVEHKVEEKASDKTTKTE